MYREIHHVGRRGDGKARTGFQGAFLHGVERITPDVEEAKGERDQSRAEQSRAEQSRAEQSRVEQSRAEQRRVLAPSPSHS